MQLRLPRYANFSLRFAADLKRNFLILSGYIRVVFLFNDFLAFVSLFPRRLSYKKIDAKTTSSVQMKSSFLTRKQRCDKMNLAKNKG